MCHSHFEGIYCLHLQGLIVATFVASKKQAIGKETIYPTKIQSNSTLICGVTGVRSSNPVLFYVYFTSSFIM
jgi:hypothetical protein